MKTSELIKALQSCNPEAVVLGWYESDIPRARGVGEIIDLEVVDVDQVRKAGDTDIVYITLNEC